MAETVARTRLQTAGLTTVSVLAGLLMLELAVRVIEPREVMRYFFMAPDSILHHRFIPGATGRYKTTEFDVTYRINRLGLRDRDVPLRKAEGTRRILMLGDSFTEGDGVEYEETFSARLQAMLDTAGLAPRWEVVNAGVGSYAPLVEFLYLMRGGLALDPDLVVLNLDLSDFFDDLGYARLARYDDRGVPLGVSAVEDERPDGWMQAGLVRIKDCAKEHTRLYNFIRLRIDRYLEGARHTVDMSGDLHLDKYAMLRPGTRTDIARDGALTFRHLAMIRDTLQARGIGFLVTVYPYGLQVGPGEWTAGREFWGFRPDTVYGTDPQDRIAVICRAQGIGVVNMCAAFRARADAGHPLYYDYNGHWRPAGHRIVAGELFAALAPLLRREDRP